MRWEQLSVDASHADAARAVGAFDVAVSKVHTEGGAGGAELAHAVIRAAEASPPLAKGGQGGSGFRMLYDLDWSIRKKIDAIATQIYGADGVAYEKPGESAIESLTRLGFDKLPICMAKTQYSLSHDPVRKGRPTGFTLPVRDIRLAGGAGFLTPLVGMIQTMPAFGRQPAAIGMDIDENERITGLF